MSIDGLLAEIRACRVCAAALPLEPRPVLQVGAAARILIVGQAPGLRAHNSGAPFTDPSGDRLRAWLGVGPDTFYDPSAFALVPMGFCYPGSAPRGGDLPPRPECAPLWRPRLEPFLAGVRLRVLLGGAALKWTTRERDLTTAAAQWRDRPEGLFVAPHPSWRNNGWLKRNPWFEAEALGRLRAQVSAALSGPSS
jgi:uracil-DNA glycosylase